MLVVCRGVKTGESPCQTGGYRLALVAGALGWQLENLGISSNPTSNSL